MNMISICQGVFEWVWKTSISAAMLTALVFLVQWLLGKRLTPRLHYALSLLVLIRLLLPAVPASSWSLDHFLPQKTRIVPPTFAVTTPIAKPSIQNEDLATTSISTPPGSLPNPALSIPCLIWLFGCVAFLVFAVWRYQRLLRLLKGGEIIIDSKLREMLDSARKEMAVRRKVTSISLLEISSPAVFGIWKVRLLLPRNILNELTKQEIRFVLRHEMAHVRRNDTLLNTLLMAVQFLHWFNPLVWLALHRIRADRETICDELVMRHTAPEEQPDYGRLLLKLIEEIPAGQRLLPNTAAMVGDKHEIKRRIIMIKNHGKKHLAGATIACIAIALLGCASFTHSATPASTSTQPVPVAAAAQSSPDAQPANNATFTVNATGTAPLTYQWVFNGDKISNSAAAPTLAANNSSSTTVVSRTAPSSDAYLVTIVSSSNSQPSANGLAPVSSSATRMGTAPIAYQWRLNGNNIYISNANTKPIVLKYNSTSTAIPSSSGSSIAIASPSNSSSRATTTFSVVATGSAPLAYQWVDPKAKVVVLADGKQVLTTDPTLISDSEASLASHLIGTWVLEKELGPQSEPSGVGTRLKNFTGTHWDIVQPDPKTGEIIFHQGGTYKIEGDKYFEHKDFAGENNKDGIGNTGKFTLKIEGDTLTQTGVNNPWNEVWKRVK